MLRSNVTRLLASAPLVAMVAITAVGSAHAQVTNGTVRGTVKDPAGKPFKGANIQLLPPKGEPLTAVTDSHGEYVFLGVQPGAYTLHVDVQSYSAADKTITVVQDTPTTVDVALSTTTIETGSSRVSVKVSPVRRGQTAVQTNITAGTEQLVKSQPDDLYQFPGLVFGQPGVTFDYGGYVHIDGGDYNQVGFQVDGIPITDPFENNFATNIITVGLKSANLVTGGADASYGNGVGFINELTQNGRDIKGGIFEYTAGPGQGWDYNGTHIEYGNVTNNGKFDFYGSTILFSNKFPGSTAVSKLNPSQDALLKLNYYANPSNTFTVYVNNGREKYSDFALPVVGAKPEFPAFDPNTGRLSFTNTPYGVGTTDQRYDLDYVNFLHKFSDKTVLNFKVASLFNRTQVPEVIDSQAFITQTSSQRDYLLDFTSQLSSANLLKAGIQYLDASSSEYYLTGIPATSDLATNGYPTNPLTASPIGYRNHPKTTTFYVNDTIRALQDKATLDIGVRRSVMNIGLPKVDLTKYTIPANSLAYDPSAYNVPSHHTQSYTDPRLGATYSPDKTLVFRTSASQNSVFSDTRRTLSAPAALLGMTSTTDPTIPANLVTQVNRFLRQTALYNPIEAQHTRSLNVGADKGFDLQSFGSGSYVFGIDLFRRATRNMLQLDAPNLANLGFFSSTLADSGRPYRYTNDGKIDTSGFSIEFTKRLVRKTDWNGFASYTNLNAKGTTSNGDTSNYAPYYPLYLDGTPGITDADFRNLIKSNEVPTGWDQHHTVAIVLNKRIWKFLDTTVFMDAGSGYPFAGGVGSNDSQHQSVTDQSAGFNQVPVVVNNNVLQPNAPVAGFTGWHYKFTLNTNFHVQENTTLFLNIDNIFTRKTATVLSTFTASGDTYYRAPTAAFPQGQVYYGEQTILSPRFLSFGVRTRF